MRGLQASGLSNVFGTLCALRRAFASKGIGYGLLLVASMAGASLAFEKWERPLGWHLQYGPRYVVFWGGPAGYTDPAVGTSSYGHYAAAPLLTAPALSPFDDFQLAKVYEEAKTVPLPLVPLEVTRLARLPFHEASPPARYAALPRNALPFTRLLNAEAVVETAKVIASELAVEFLAQLRQQTDEKAVDSLETQAARLLSFCLSVFEGAAMTKQQQPLSKEQTQRVYSFLLSAFKAIGHHANLDIPKYAYWLDASNKQPGEGGPLYVPELEASRWSSALASLTVAGISAANSPYGQLLASSQKTTYMSCDHFTSSAASASTPERERLCANAFLVLMRGVIDETKTRIPSFSERGQKLITAALQRLERDLASHAQGQGNHQARSGAEKTREGSGTRERGCIKALRNKTEGVRTATKHSLFSRSLTWNEATCSRCEVLSTLKRMQASLLGGEALFGAPTTGSSQHTATAKLRLVQAAARRFNEVAFFWRLNSL
ncbi:hypothetical protein Esti_005207 [Eimeria stiedai]